MSHTVKMGTKVAIIIRDPDGNITYQMGEIETYQMGEIEVTDETGLDIILSDITVDTTWAGTGVSTALNEFLPWDDDLENVTGRVRAHIYTLPLDHRAVRGAMVRGGVTPEA